MNARISLACQECGDRFELTPDQVAVIGLDNQRKFCDRRCAKAAAARRWLEQWAPLSGCAGCERTADMLVWGVPFCTGCNNIIGKSCLRKQPHPSREAAVSGDPVRTSLYPYWCPVCEWWHASQSAAPSDYQDRTNRIGAALRSAGVSPGGVIPASRRFFCPPRPVSA